MIAVFQVAPTIDGWVVERPGSRKGSAVCSTQAAAVDAAAAVLRKAGGVVRVVTNINRVCRELVIIGGDGFARLAAVEGISLTPEAKARLCLFDAADLSDAERRRMILEAHRGTP